MTRAFGAHTTTDEVIAGVDLSGRQALVTGASGGLGAETARALAAAGAGVTLAARNTDKAEAVAAGIRASTGNAAVDVLALELTDHASVRGAATRFLDTHPRLHLLVNNAGVMACPLERTAEGWELQLATNHIGHFLLTCLLVPALRAAAPSRVVNLSSAGHRFSDVDLGDPHYERRPYDKWEAYGQSKTANVLFSVELDRRLSASGVRAFAVHPGMIMTELGRHLAPEDIQDLMSRTPAGSRAGSGDAADAGDGAAAAAPEAAAMPWKTVEQGAATATWAATAPELEGRGGLYCADCGVGQVADEHAFGMTGYAAYAMDADAARRLWALSEQWVGERFPLS